jgi:ubiquinone/menaquinone biosynthesis C-methylase UbiE
MTVGLSDSLCYFLNESFTKLEQVRPIYEGGKMRVRSSDSATALWEFERGKFEWNFYNRLISLEDKRVLDVGCGYGGKSVFYATLGARVVGIDIRPSKLTTAMAFAKEKQIGDRAQFVLSDASSIPFPADSFDMVISNNTMQYLQKPLEGLHEYERVVKRAGLICINFGPPWFAPDCPDLGRCFPWTHLLFSEKAIRKALTRMGRTRVSDRLGGLYSHMNKMTIRKYRQLLSSTNLDLLYFRLWTRPYVAPLVWFPLTREFFCAQVISILRKR